MPHFTLIPLDNYKNSENPASRKADGFSCICGKEKTAYRLLLPVCRNISIYNCIFRTSCPGSQSPRRFPPLFHPFQQILIYLLPVGLIEQLMAVSRIKAAVSHPECPLFCTVHRFFLHLSRNHLPDRPYLKRTEQAALSGSYRCFLFFS